MDKTLLNQFQNEPFMREAVKDFFLAEMDKLALERVYSRGDTQSVADAREVIENAFITLKEEFDKNKEKPVQNLR